MASTMDKNPNPTTPPLQDALEYAEAYLSIHTMSSPSNRYAYLLWFGIVLVSIIFALLHWTGSRGGALGALWSKWTLRRRTWRKKQALEATRRNPAAHRQPFSFPSNAQLLSFFALALFTLCACFIGPDYIAPSARLWQFHAIPDILSQPSQPEGPPAYTIHKAWWTVGGRAGIIAFSLYPLVILFALKTPPFALLALPFFLQLHFDKLSRIHRWSGVLVWIISTIHVATWGVQLALDRRVGVDNQVLWLYVWGYNKFVYGCLAYFCLTLLVLLSVPVIRSAYYEAFYALHVLLVPLTILMSGFHFPRIGWWCWVAMGVWVGERCWRAARVSWINGLFFPSSRSLHQKQQERGQAWEMDESPRIYQRPYNHAATYSEQFDISMYTEPANSLLPDPLPRRPSMPDSDSIPPGYGWAHLLPGRTIRIKVVTQRSVYWSPGQHILLRVPSISKLTTHPFTIASVCRSPVRTGPQRIQPVELLIRAKAGFTRDLWNEVHRLSTQSRTQVQQPSVGALLKVQIDGPFGSVSRTKWGIFSSMLIICGGSGVSFGIAVLEFLCLCISGHKPSSLGSSPGGLGYSGFRTRRIRFVWLVREYSHLQWCAAALWRCSRLLPADALEIDIFVTNISRTVRQRHGPTNPPPVGQPLDPPTPSFARGHGKHNSWASVSMESEDDLRPPITPSSTIYSVQEEPDLHPLDLTNFDGDDDSFMPGEAQLSYQVHKVGHIRRRETQRLSKVRGDKGSRLPRGPIVPPSYAPVVQDYSSGSEGISSYKKEFNSYPSKTPSELPGHASTDYIASPSSANPLLQFRPDVQMDINGLQIEDEDARALMAISEIARSGKPQLDSILAEEVDRSEGAIGVACCGPTSLNALVRKLVATRIDPARVRAGDLRGSITLISEDFDY